MRRISRSGACYLGRNRKNTEAAELNSGEEIRQPGGVLDGAFGGNQERRARASYSKKRCANWWSKSPGTMSGRKMATGANPVRESRTRVEDEMRSSLMSSIFFPFSIFCFSM